MKSTWMEAALTHTLPQVVPIRNTVLIKSDGTAVAVGSNSGQCDLPALDGGVTYTYVAVGAYHTVLLRSDGTAVAGGNNMYGQSALPTLDVLRYISPSPPQTASSRGDPAARYSQREAGARVIDCARARLRCSAS